MPPALDQAKLIGAGDGSVLLYCTTHRRCIAPHVRDLATAAELWTKHTTAHHPAEELTD